MTRGGLVNWFLSFFLIDSHHWRRPFTRLWDFSRTPKPRFSPRALDPGQD
jgi:hypothetical protein